MEDRRIARFSILRNIIDNEPDLAKQILKDCIIVRAECDFATDSVQYMAINEDFLPIGQGQVVPEVFAVLSAIPEEQEDGSVVTRSEFKEWSY